jgi:hypothetical protein
MADREKIRTLYKIKYKGANVNSSVIRETNTKVYNNINKLCDCIDSILTALCCKFIKLTKLLKEIKMPILSKKPVQAKPATEVNVATAKTATKPAEMVTVKHHADYREVTLILPLHKSWSDDEIAAAESEKGKEVEAIDDLTGELIFNKKNVNLISNEERPELNGKVISTRLLAALVEKLDETPSEA